MTSPPSSKTTATSTLSLRSAIVVGPTASAAGAVTLSCHGDAFCREDVILASSHGGGGAVGDDAAEDVRSACARHRGTIEASACPREGTIASCAVVGGEAGPITVFGYAQANANEQTRALATMTDLCEHFEGSLTLTAP